MPSDRPDKPVHVVAAVLRDARGRILLARRTAGRDLAGAWEFPGGKVEPGETALQALDRNTRLQPMSPFGWYQMARVHVDLQQPDEARAVIRHLKGFEPKVAAQLELETGLRAGF